MIIKRIKIPIYFGTLVIIFDDDLKEVEKKYKTSSLSTYAAVVFENEKAKYHEYVVAIRNDSPGSIIAHECVHLTNKLFKNVGVELDINNDESQAYMTGWFFHQIDKFKNKG